MRFLVDQNVPLAVVDGLQEDEHDVTWAQTAYPGADDEVLLNTAQEEDRILLTFDTDFGTLAFHRDLPASSGIVLFRLTLVSPSAVAKTVRETIRSREDWQGHFSVVDDTQIRMRPLPE
jgi:predicted nuclease of predicted toxin-antitoxin system